MNFTCRLLQEWLSYGFLCESIIWIPAEIPVGCSYRNSFRGFHKKYLLGIPTKNLLRVSPRIPSGNYSRNSFWGFIQELSINICLGFLRKFSLGMIPRIRSRDFSNNFCRIPKKYFCGISERKS